MRSKGGRGGVDGQIRQPQVGKSNSSKSQYGFFSKVNRADKRRIKHMVARVMKKDREPGFSSGKGNSLMY